jgi:hypothetical protein
MGDSCMASFRWHHMECVICHNFPISRIATAEDELMLFENSYRYRTCSDRFPWMESSAYPVCQVPGITLVKCSPNSSTSISYPVIQSFLTGIESSSLVRA